VVCWREGSEHALIGRSGKRAEEKSDGRVGRRLVNKQDWGGRN
jgi:hypothetical protein